MKDPVSSKLDLLDNLHGQGEAASILKVLLLDLFDKPATFKYYDLLQEELLMLDSALQRVLNDEPVQYITGKSWFYGLEFYVDQRVLVPRPETEELVEKAIDISKKHSYKTALDIGTGSGCIPIVLKKYIPELNIFAMDISEDAIDVARINADLNGTDILFFKDDILNPNVHFDNRFDLIISNPPYIEVAEKARMSLSALKYEPELALFCDNVLQFYRAVFSYAFNNLSPGGTILLECNEFFGIEILDLAVEMGYNNVELHADIRGKDRMLVIKDIKI